MTTEEAYLKFAEVQRQQRKGRINSLSDDIPSVLARLQDMASMDYPNNEHWLQLVVDMRHVYAYFEMYCREKQ